MDELKTKTETYAKKIDDLPDQIEQGFKKLKAYIDKTEVDRQTASSNMSPRSNLPIFKSRFYRTFATASKMNALYYCVALGCSTWATLSFARFRQTPPSPLFSSSRPSICKRSHLVLGKLLTKMAIGLAREYATFIHFPPFV